jgi:hypothetical protein
MKSAIRTFVLAAIAAASFAATTHTASAPIYSRNTSADYNLQSGGYITVNALTIGQSGNFTLGGQQSIANEGTQPAYVYCWVSAAVGSPTPLPYGLTAATTIAAGAWATLSFYGWYSVSGSTNLYVVCRTTNPSGVVLATTGNITAAKN